MPRRNRVTPFGTLVAVAARGSLMGNRGDLHDCSGAIVRPWKSRAWISCRLQYRQQRAIFDRRGHYTPLFFTDEAVALAAGHRPCALCRREDYRRFVACFRRAHGIAPESRLTAGEIDAALQAGRIAGGAQITFEARLGELPDGSFVTAPAKPGEPLLLWRGRLHRWAMAGYSPGEEADPQAAVRVLTPRPLVAVLRAGYRPATVLDEEPAGQRRR